MTCHLYRTATVVAGLATLTALSGCDGLIIYEPVTPQRYGKGDFDYAARSGEMRTEVIGNPFGNVPDFGALVAEHMYKANRGPAVKFVLAPGGGASAPYRVVMAFNPAPRVSAADICSQGSWIQTAPGTEPVTVLSAFCSGDLVVSEAGGRIGSVTGPRDPKFHSLVQAVTSALIPIDDRKGIGKG
jgi:hypothetical protein